MWEEYYQHHKAVWELEEHTEASRRAKMIVQDARRLLTLEDQNRDSWVYSALHDDERKWFVALVLEKNVPRRFFAPMIQAAVYERNPSFNRRFVEPCTLSFGPRPVCQALLTYLTDGTNVEKAGASNALYWVTNPLRWKPSAPNFRPESATPESHAAYLALSDLRARIGCARLHEFVINSDVDVRRSIIGQLSLDPADYPTELQPLIPQAVNIARHHPDDYIRHRVEIQLGSSSGTVTFKPLPHRQPPSNDQSINELSS